MRLQLIFILACTHAFVWSQNSSQEKKEITVDFLSSYYEQDGIHSAVTGGEGTEALFDIANKIIVTVPLKTNRSLSFQQGISYFSSASSDEVDPRTISGASSNDARISLDATYSIADSSNTINQGFSAGLSHEMHFLSTNIGYGLQKKLSSKTRFNFTSRFLLDIWGQYYPLTNLYPIELRYKGELLEGKNRYTLQLNWTLQQVISRRMQVQIGIEAIQQFGILSTPYHRVGFIENVEIDIERLPSYRLRTPVTLKLNYYVKDWLILKSSSRGYYDNFGIMAFSQEFRPVVRIKNSVSVFPFYRFHIQTASRYFAPKDSHSVTSEFYSSDYDMSALQTHLIGAGLRWSPVNGIKESIGVKKNQKKNLLRYIEARGMYYQRNEGLRSWMVSFGFGFSFY